MNAARSPAAGREAQLHELHSLLVCCGAAVPPALFVHGPPASGKSHVLRVLAQQHFSTAASSASASFSVVCLFVHCVECCSERVLFKLVLSQLCERLGAAAPSVCNSAAAFVGHVQRALPSTTSLIVVLDHAEHLLVNAPATLPLLLRLSEWCDRNICAVLVSHRTWSFFRDCFAGSTTGSSTAASASLVSACASLSNEPCSVYFPPYSREQAHALLMEGVLVAEAERFDVFLHSVVLGQLWPLTHDLTELRAAATLLYALWKAPLDSGLFEWNKADTAVVGTLYTAVMPYVKVLPRQRFTHWTSESLAAAVTADPNAPRVAASTGAEWSLPHAGKWLLIASYFASYLPAKYDEQLWSFTHHKTQRRTQTVIAPLTSAAAVPRERLVAIYHAITASDAVCQQLTGTVDLQSLVLFLCELGLVQRVGEGDTARYRCAALRTFVNSMVKAVAPSREFSLEHYHL